MLRFLLLLLCIGILNGAAAQERDRIELPLPAESDSYHTVPLGSKGVVLVSKPQKRKYRIQKFNTELKEEWATDGDIHSNLDFVASTYDGTSVYLLFNRYRSSEYQVVKVSAGPGFVENFLFQTVDRFLITDFKTIGYSAFLAGTIRDEPVLIHSNLQSGQSKVLPTAIQGATSIQSVEVDTTFQVVNVSFSVKNRRSMQIVARTYDESGQMISEVSAQPDQGYALLNGRLQILNETEKLLIGTYGYSDRQSSSGAASQGLYISKFTGNREDFTQFHSFTDFQHFFDFLSGRQLEKIERKIQKKKETGSDVKLNYQLLVHDIIPSDHQYLIVAEVFYPEYKYTNMYSSRGYWGNPWLFGSGFGYGLYNPYFFNPYYGAGRYYGNNNRVLDGFVFTHAIVAGVDFSGKLLWDNSVIFDNFKSNELRERVTVSEKNSGETQIVFGNRGSIWTKVVKEDKTIKKEESIALTTQLDGDRVRSTTTDEICHWYGPYYLAWGQQRISNPQADAATRGRRNVFYLNKLSIE